MRYKQACAIVVERLGISDVPISWTLGTGTLWAWVLPHHRSKGHGPVTGSGTNVDYTHKDVESLIAYVRSGKFGQLSSRLAIRDLALRTCRPGWALSTSRGVRFVPELRAKYFREGGYAIPIHEECR